MPKGIKNFHLSFEEKAITHYGGLFQIHKFCQRLKLKELLQIYLHSYRYHSNYQVAELILFFMYYIIVGIVRIDNTRPLQFNGVFKKLLGVKNFPDPTTLRRFLHQMPPTVIRQIVQVHNILQQKLFFIHSTQTSVIFDLDPTVITVYGKQQKAKTGYNPKKRGKRCYSLFLCFESHHQEFWLGSLRSGNTHPITLARHFLKECVAKLPKTVKRIRIRADASFFDHKFVEFLDEMNIGYTIEAQSNKPLQRIAYGLQYHPYKKDWKVAEFVYQSKIWKKPRRWVVQRRPLPEDPEEKSQLSLFTIKGYGYRMILTNLKLKPRHAWNFHNQRAQGAELNIKELKNSYPLTRIPTQSYTANIAYLQMLLFAFNIINWFKRLCLPKKYRFKTLKSIRQDLIAIPARLVTSGRKNMLKFPAGYPHQKLFYQILGKIKNMEI